MDQQTVQRLRADTPACANVIHLNNAGAALMPRPVLDAVREYLEFEANTGGYEAARQRASEIDAAYANVAKLLGCQSRNIAFVENATVAYSQALSAIPFQADDVILTSEQDYVSNQIMFLSLARRLGIRLVRAPTASAGGVDVEAMIKLMDQHRPALVALTHVPTNAGTVQPVEEIGRACRERELVYLVDACQSVGQIDVNVARIECDFLAATSRKFLRGPRGCGFLFASDRVLSRGLAPLYIDLRGARWTSADSFEPVESAVRFENWEFAYALVIGTSVAAKYASEIGLNEIETRVELLAGALRNKLRAAGFRVLDEGEKLCGIVTVAVPNMPRGAMEETLARRKINVDTSVREYGVIDFARKGIDWALRISPHYYNTEDELNAAVTAIGENVWGIK